jgi:peptidoglycan/xylan/chitin deacetylase (PgdA/CDA1 family)
VIARLPGGGGALRNRSRAAAFLCYHSVHAAGPPFLSLSPEMFERQLALLRRKGYRSGDLAGLAALASGRRLPAPLAYMTFDDGFRDNYTEAFPLLRSYGASALVFILPPAVDDGAPLAWPEVDERRRRHPEIFRSLTWSMVEEMAEAGVEFGSHTSQHHDLTGLANEALMEDLLESRRRIAERLGRCDALAYPFGAWNPRVAAAAAAAGYRWAFTMPSGAQASATPLSIPRIAVDQRDDEARFAVKLTAAARGVLLSPARGWARGVRRSLQRAPAAHGAQ